jgi:SAM-dependent methyltransferase
MQNNDQRIVHEIDHGKKIKEHAEDIWGWSTNAGKKRAERRADYFVTLGNFTNNSKILEIGCGTALFTEKVYSKTKANITAIDISEDLLDRAKKKLPEVRFIREDAMQMSFLNNEFDCVWGSSVLHHLDVDLALKEMYRVLKPGGSLIFAEPNMMNPQIFIQKNVPFIKKWMGDSPDEIAFIRWKLNRLMQQVGYKEIRIFPYDFLHPATPKILIKPVRAVGQLFEKIPVIREIAGSLIIYAKK